MRRAREDTGDEEEQDEAVADGCGPPPRRKRRLHPSTPPMSPTADVDLSKMAISLPDLSADYYVHGTASPCHAPFALFMFLLSLASPPPLLFFVSFFVVVVVPEVPRRRLIARHMVDPLLVHTVLRFFSNEFPFLCGLWGCRGLVFTREHALDHGLMPHRPMSVLLLLLQRPHQHLPQHESLAVMGNAGLKAAMAEWQAQHPADQVFGAFLSDEPGPSCLPVAMHWMTFPVCLSDHQDDGRMEL
jgi:hypothetical protein